MSDPVDGWAIRCLDRTSVSQIQVSPFQYTGWGCPQEYTSPRNSTSSWSSEVVGLAPRLEMLSFWTHVIAKIVMFDLWIRYDASKLYEGEWYSTTRKVLTLYSEGITFRSSSKVLLLNAHCRLLSLKTGNVSSKGCAMTRTAPPSLSLLPSSKYIFPPDCYCLFYQVLKHGPILFKLGAR